MRRRFVLVAILIFVFNLACSLSASDRNPSTPTPVETGRPPISTTPIVTYDLAPPAPQNFNIEADAEERLLINIYERTSPAVVNIKVVTQNPFLEGTDLVGGTGFVIDPQGHIVTNNHVIADAESILVTFSSGMVLEATLVAADEDSDLAVLKVDALPEGLAPLELGSSRDLRVGQRVIAIGSPWELQGTMTTGIISALGRTLEARIAADGGYYSIPDVIQTDAAINPGNSGGPLLDSQGYVIGVNSAIRSEGLYNSGVGFAVPVDIVNKIVPALIQQGRYHYPYLGISSNPRVSVAELSREIDLPVNYGVLISSLVPDGPAEQAGLRESDGVIQVLGQQISVGGDIVIAIDGQRVFNFDELMAFLVRETEVGQVITLTVVRGQDTLELPLTLGERP